MNDSQHRKPILVYVSQRPTAYLIIFLRLSITTFVQQIWARSQGGEWGVGGGAGGGRTGSGREGSHEVGRVTSSEHLPASDTVL